MELTLLVLIITIIVSIRRSAWYQRYKVRGNARVVGEAKYNWILVDERGMPTLSAAKPVYMRRPGGQWSLIAQDYEKPLNGYYPALRNQVFLK